jgi:hypothetical protein
MELEPFVETISETQGARGQSAAHLRRVATSRAVLPVPASQPARPTCAGRGPPCRCLLLPIHHHHHHPPTYRAPPSSTGRSVSKALLDLASNNLFTTSISPIQITREHVIIIVSC